MSGLWRAGVPSKSIRDGPEEQEKKTITPIEVAPIGRVQLVSEYRRSYLRRSISIENFSLEEAVVKAHQKTKFSHLHSHGRLQNTLGEFQDTDSEFQSHPTQTSSLRSSASSTTPPTLPSDFSATSFLNEPKINRTSDQSFPSLTSSASPSLMRRGEHFRGHNQALVKTLTLTRKTKRDPSFSTEFYDFETEQSRSVLLEGLISPPRERKSPENQREDEGLENKRLERVSALSHQRSNSLGGDFVPFKPQISKLNPGLHQQSADSATSNSSPNSTISFRKKFARPLFKSSLVPQEPLLVSDSSNSLLTISPRSSSSLIISATQPPLELSPSPSMESLPTPDSLSSTGDPALPTSSASSPSLTISSNSTFSVSPTTPTTPPTSSSTCGEKSPVWSSTTATSSASGPTHAALTIRSKKQSQQTPSSYFSSLPPSSSIPTLTTTLSPSVITTTASSSPPGASLSANQPTGSFSPASSPPTSPSTSPLQSPRSTSKSSAAFQRENVTYNLNLVLKENKENRDSKEVKFSKFQPKLEDIFKEEKTKEEKKFFKSRKSRYIPTGISNEYMPITAIESTSGQTAQSPSSSGPSSSTSSSASSPSLLSAVVPNSNKETATSSLWNPNGTGPHENIDEDGCIFNYFDDGSVSIKAATRKKLIQKIIHKDSSSDQIQTFLLTYLIWCTHPEFFDLLKECIEEPQDLAVWKSALTLIRSWQQLYETDFVPSLLYSSTSMPSLPSSSAPSLPGSVSPLSSQTSSSLAPPSSSLAVPSITSGPSGAGSVSNSGSGSNTEESLSNLFHGFLSGSPSEFLALYLQDVNDPSHSPSLHKRSGSKVVVPKFKRMNLLDVPNEEIARQLTLIEHSLFCRLRFTHFLNSSWTKSDKELSAPSIVSLIDHFNKVSMWVATMVVTGLGTKEQSSLIKKFVAIADHCLLLNNFNALMEISAGLQQISVSRLTDVWEEVSSKNRKQYQNLVRLTEPTKNYKTLRDHIKSLQPNIALVPYIGLFLGDLLYIDEASKTIIPPPNNPFADKKKDGWINFEKCKLIADILKEIRKYQNCSYSIDPQENIQNWLSSVEPLGEQELYEKSCKQMPRKGAETNSASEKITKKELLIRTQIKSMCLEDYHTRNAIIGMIEDELKPQIISELKQFLLNEEQEMKLKLRKEIETELREQLRSDLKDSLREEVRRELLTQTNQQSPSISNSADDQQWRKQIENQLRQEMESEMNKFRKEMELNFQNFMNQQDPQKTKKNYKSKPKPTKSKTKEDDKE